MKFYAIIKKGTKNDPIWMGFADGGDEVYLEQDDDNLPEFQPFPEFIDKDELDEMDGELVELEIIIK